MAGVFPAGWKTGRSICSIPERPRWPGRAEMPDQPRWRDHLLLVCSVAVGLIFGVSGLQKLFYLDVPAGEFAVWGYPRWLLFAVGAAELLGALLLQRARWRVLGAWMLSGVVVAAAYTHLRHVEYAAMWRPVILGAMLVLILWLVRRGGAVDPAG
ncbi:MAG: hypothetical protein C0629_02650 [Chromatiales bacterium]|nr:MAG: hypothetical protein C0629_02650 [Chromatiales bacterium]